MWSRRGVAGAVGGLVAEVVSKVLHLPFKGIERRLMSVLKYLT